MANKTIPTIQTNEGNVGIGTTNPIASLEVDNSIASLPVLNLGGGEAGNNVSDLYVLNSYNNNTGVGYAAKVIGVNISGSLTDQNVPVQRTTWGGVTSATAIALGTDGPRAGFQDNAFQIWTTENASAGTLLTQKFSVTSAGDVGIGTVAPAQKLDVNGAIIAGINNSYAAYTRTPGGVLKPWFATASANTFFYNTNVSGSIFWQNAADTATLMILTEQARLGINTNAPSGRLHVLDTVLYPPSLTWNAAAATIIRSENGQIAFGSDDTAPYGIWQQVRTSSSTARPLLLNPLGGNVGVGTRNPSASLEVAGSLRVTGVGQIGPAGGYGFALFNDQTNVFAGQIYGRANGLQFTDNLGNASVYIASGGNVGIGEQSPVVKLQVTSNIEAALFKGSATWGSAIQIEASSAGGRVYQIQSTANGAGEGGGRLLLVDKTAGGTRLTIKSDGNIGIGTTNPTKKLQVAGSLYWDLNGTSAEEHIVGIQRVVAAANGSYTEIGSLAASANSIRATFEIFHHDSSTIEYSLFELIANYYTGTTTDWVQLPSRTQAHYAGAPNGVVVDARLTTTGGSVELRLRSIGGAGGAMTVNVRIKSNTNLTETSGTGTGATVAGLLGFNRYEFPVTDNRFKATYDGLFIKNNGFIGIGSTDPVGKLTVQGNIEVNYNSTAADTSVRRSFLTSHAVINRGANISFGLLDGASGPAGMTVYNVAAAAGAYNSQFITFLTHEGGVNEGERMRITQLGNVGIGTFTPLSLLSVGTSGSTTAAKGLTFGGDAQANLYRAAEDTIKTDGSLNVAGLIYNSNGAYYSSVSKSTTANWGQYSVILGNASYSANLIHVSINGGNVVWAGTFLASTNISYRPNETWGTVKLLECATYNCSNDDVTLLTLSDSSTSQYGVPALVLKTNGAVNGGYGTGYANNITVTVNGPSPNGFTLSSSSWAQPYTYLIATSANTKQIFTSENGTVGVGTYFPASAKLESFTSANSITFNHLATNLNNTSPIPTYAFDVTNGVGESRSIKAGIGYERHLANGRGTLHIYNRATNDAVNFGGSRSTPSDIRVSIDNDGNVGINTTLPGAKLDVVGTARLSSNLLSHKVASYTTSYPGISSFGADATDSNITYYDTGKTVLNTQFRGVVWTGKHYIFTDYANYKAYFYDNNFNQIKNAYGYDNVSLPLPSGYDYPHGAAWDGRYLWIVCYAGSASKIVGYDLDSSTQTATIIAESAAISAIPYTYDIEYADGHLYLVHGGTLFIYKWNGSSIDAISNYPGAAGGISAQALTYDGSYLWATQNGALIYKIGLNGAPIATLSSGYPPNTCGWAWNGSNIVSFDYSNRNIFIINTNRLRIDTQNLALMGGRVGIGSTTPAALLNIRASIPTSVGSTPAGTNLLIDSNTSNYITFRNTVDNGTYAGLIFLDNNVGGYIAFGNAGAAVGSDSMLYGAYQDHIFQNNYVNETLYNRTETMRIKQNGRVGIGTNAPATLLSIGGAGSTSAASGLTFGAEAASNIYRSSTNQLKTDGSFVVTNTLIVGGGENGVRILKDGSDSISSTLYLANAGNTRAYNFQQNAAGTNLALWSYNSSNAWQNLVNFNYNGNVGIGTTAASGRLHVVSATVGDTIIRADGTNGTLFSIVDDLSDSLMSVNNSAGLPVLEVFADDRVVMGQYGSGDLVVRNNKVGIGTTNPINKLSVIGGASIGSTTYNTAAPANGLIVQGNVGIGGTIPNCKLDVRGELQVASSSAYTTHLNYNDVGTNFITTANGGTTYFRGSTNNLTSMTVDGAGTVTTYYNTYLGVTNGNVGIGTNSAAQKLDVSGNVRASRYIGINSLTLNTYATVNPTSNVFLYSQGNDRDSWLYLDSADTASNWGIYHRQIDSAVSSLPANSIGFIGGGNSSLKAYIGLADGAGYFAGNVGVGTTNALSLLGIGATSSTTAANGITFGGDAQANIYRNAEDTLATDGNFNAAGNVNSSNSRATTYTSITSGTNGTWYPLFQVNDATDAVVICNIRTYAHGSASFIATKGYGPSQTHTITVLNYNFNPNGGFANIVGIRIRQSGWVEIQLSWTSGPTVNIGVQIIGTNYTPTFAANLTPTAASDAIVDTAFLSQGMLRSYGNIITAGGSVGVGTTNPTSRLHVVETTPTGSRIQLGSTSTNGLMNAGLVNDFLILTAPFNAVPASTSNNNAKWGIKMGGGSTDSPNALEKSACIYAVSEEDIGGGGAGAGYNRKVGLALHTSPFDLPNVERVRINNLGNVGIGTTAPSYRLDITGGDINFASNSVLRFGTVSVLNASSNANDIYANLRVIRNSSATLADGMYIGYDGVGTTAAHLRFYANGITERMRIQANDGFVGIGTATAVGRLDVYDDTNAGHVSFVRNNNTGSSAYTAIVLRRNGGTNGLVMFTNSSNRSTDGGVSNSTIRTDNGKLLLGANGTTYHALETDGNVGIGLTNPVAARLHIKGDGSNPVLRVESALLAGAAGGTAGKTFVGWMPIQTGALSPADTVYIPLYK